MTIYSFSAALILRALATERKRRPRGARTTFPHGIARHSRAYLRKTCSCMLSAYGMNMTGNERHHDKVFILKWRTDLCFSVTGGDWEMKS
jgi:hypothetical protein